MLESWDFELAQIFHALHQLLRLLEIHRRLAAKQTALAAQPVFQLADLLELHQQLLEFFFGVGIFETVGSQLLDRLAGFARQIVQKLLLFLNVLARLVHLFESLLLLVDHRVELLLDLVHGRLQLYSS